MTNLTDLQKVRLGPLTVLDGAGKVITPSPIDGVPTWTNSNEDAVTLAVDPDGLNAWAISNNPFDGTPDHTGTSQIVATADCQPGSGVTEFSASADIAVGFSAAAGVQLPAGTPVDK